MRLRRLALILFSGAAAWLSPPVLADAPRTDKEIKAAVAFNVLQFVAWPAGTLPPGKPLALCAPEASESAALLARYQGMRVRDAQLAFIPLNRHLDGLGDCQAVFVDAGAPYAALQVAAAARERPILVIAEGDLALQQGAGIGVSLAGSHVVLDVNLVALEASGMTVSSKLLRLARRVIR